MRKYLLSIILLVLLLMPPVLATGNVKINDFSANVTSGTIPLHTRFYSDVTGNVTTWRWIFTNIGTGATTYSSSNPSTHHNFKKPGVYNVTLKVWGPDGNDTLTKPAYITAATVTAKPATSVTAEPAESADAESAESISTETDNNNGNWDQYDDNQAGYDDRWDDDY